MSRKLYPGEARKVRAMLDKDFTDVEISRALHVAQSTISNMRNESQNDAVETESEPVHEPEKIIVDSENPKDNENIEETDTITFVEGTKHKSEEAEKSKAENEESTGTITYVGGRKHKEPEEEDFDWECEGCGHEFNGNPSNCPGCGMEVGYDGNSEKKGSLDLGTIIAGLGGLATVGFLIHRARGNNQNWSDTSWNDQGAPWINRIFNNQNQVM